MYRTHDMKNDTYKALLDPDLVAQCWQKRWKNWSLTFKNDIHKESSFNLPYVLAVLLLFLTELRIRDILVRIRIRGFVPTSYDEWIRIQLLSSLTFKTPTKSFSAYYFFKMQLHPFSKIKSQKSRNSRNQGFYPYYFCLNIEGSGSVPYLVLMDPDRGGPKTLRILCT